MFDSGQIERGGNANGVFFWLDFLLKLGEKSILEVYSNFKKRLIQN